MKLSKTQYQDIRRLLAEFGINQEKLSLVKKKGRIKLHIEGIETTFEFFRRKSVSLTEEDHQWQKSELYEVNAAGKASIVANWNEVISLLHKWLKASI